MILDDSEEKMEGGRGSSKKENKTLTDRQLTIDVFLCKEQCFLSGFKLVPWGYVPVCACILYADAGV